MYRIFFKFIVINKVQKLALPKVLLLPIHDPLQRPKFIDNRPKFHGNDFLDSFSTCEGQLMFLIVVNLFLISLFLAEATSFWNLIYWQYSISGKNIFSTIDFHGLPVIVAVLHQHLERRNALRSYLRLHSCYS